MEDLKHFVVMPAEYFNDYIRVQLCLLLSEDALKDVSLTFRTSSLNVSAFAVALLSPVLRENICGNPRKSAERQFNLDDIEKELFVSLLQLACGEAIHEAKNLETQFELAELSKRLQMNAVTAILEDRLVKELKTETCVEMLARGETSGLRHLQGKCHQFVCKHFVAISNTDSLLQLSKEAMERLLEEDELGTGREEDIFEASARWKMKHGNETDQRRHGLLRKIRFGVIGNVYLAEDMLKALPGDDELKQLIAKAMVKKGKEQQRIWDGVERLCEKWLVPRGLKGKIFGYGMLKQPQYVATDCQGRILVSDRVLDQVVVFCHDGSVAQYIGSEGEGEGQFNGAAGIAVDHRGNIFIADHCNHRIQMFNADGLFARCLGGQGSAAGQLYYPEGVAVDAGGQIVVADRCNHRIQAFNPDGSVAFVFGVEGEAVGQLCEPSGVAVDGAGRIVVSEYENNRVQVFNRDGSVALCFGSTGDGPGQFNRPAGVAVDQEGRLLVADMDNHRVQVFEADGGVVKVVGREGSGVGDCMAPTGVAVDAAGRIVVAEACNGRVQVL